MKASTQNPLAAYDVGYIGWTHVPGELADGICYFERWDRVQQIAVSHALVVTGTEFCVEAHWPRVAAAPLANYFNDPKTVIVFRRPRGWTPELGQRIADAAASKVGAKYDLPLILSQLAAHTLCGHYLNKWFNNRPDDYVSRWLDRKDQFICSELAAFALNEQPEFRGKGILSRPLDTINPQELFEDPVLFEAPIFRTR